MGPSAAVSAIDPASANRRATGALVSIVIPCYKQARFLADAIESALAQTYRTIEIVVVNDGSPDETAAVAARYPPVRYIEQDNAGLAAARNTGLANSCGEFVVFLDADDRLLRDAVQTNVDRLTADEAVAFVAGLSYYIASGGGCEATRRGSTHGVKGGGTLASITATTWPIGSASACASAWNGAASSPTR